ncbi:MAG TPA: DUF2189 domain-containing protein [Acetobacteraceae bacterium]|nr:DUF2189 domain-containing protein [Acetobacteraceae bacterium]
MIQMPIGWGWDRLRTAAHDVGSSPDEEYWPGQVRRRAVPALRRIGLTDLTQALASGLDDFKANRTDVIFLCVLYPAAGLVLWALASGYGLLPLVFPLASGFALLGPLAALGLYEMSRRRELGMETSWVDAFRVLRSPSIGAIALLGVSLVVLFVLWLMAANIIYLWTLGPEPPQSLGGFLRAVFTTADGWIMIAAGLGIGFLFAVVVLAISVVSFPLLLDRDTGVDTAVSFSVHSVRANPGPFAVWGMIVASGLVLGSIPCLIGLVIVLPVLGHATWHLYRRLVRD